MVFRRSAGFVMEQNGTLFGFDICVIRNISTFMLLVCASLDHTLIITCLFSLADDVDVYSFGYVWNLYGIILLDELLVACMNTFTLLENVFSHFFLLYLNRRVCF